MEDIEKFITSAMKKCADDNASALAENCEEAGKMAAKMLRQRTRVRTGAYKKGWKADVEQDETGVSCTVHNRTRYQLTHLLEKGHRIVNQSGTYPGTVPGDDVIASVAEEVASTFADMGGDGE